MSERHPINEWCVICGSTPTNPPLFCGLCADPHAISTFCLVCRRRGVIDEVAEAQKLIKASGGMARVVAGIIFRFQDGCPLCNERGPYEFDLFRINPEPILPYNTVLQ